MRESATLLKRAQRLTASKASASLTDLDNLPEPDELAEEIIENLEAGLASFREVLSQLDNNN